MVHELTVLIQTKTPTVSNPEYIWGYHLLVFCKLRLVILPWWGLQGEKKFIFITLDHWKRYFQEKNYIENYFYLLKSTKSTKTISQKC